MAPFFLDVWMEMASQGPEAAVVKTEKKTLFFIPSNDDQLNAAPMGSDKDASQA